MIGSRTKWMWMNKVNKVQVGQKLLERECQVRSLHAWGWLEAKKRVNSCKRRTKW